MTKKFTMTLGALLLMATPATAALQNVQKAPTQIEKSFNGLEIMSHHERVAAANATKTPAMKLPRTSVITSAEGDMIQYQKNAAGYYLTSNNTVYFYEGALTGEVVFGKNNKVYFKDIITYAGLDTYIEGDLKNDKITVSLPQTVYFWDQYGYGLDLCLLEYDAARNFYFVADVDSVEFSYNRSTGEIKLNLPGEEEDFIIGLAYTDDDSWSGFGDIAQEYIPMTIQPNTVPDNVKMETWTFGDAYNAYDVEVGSDSENIYIRGFVAALPDGVVIAKRDGNKATISQNQYIGQYGNYTIYTKCFVVRDGYLYLADENAVYELNVDLENKVITNGNNNGLLLAFNASLDSVYYLEAYEDFKIAVQTTYEGTPSNPYNLEFLEDYYDDYGCYIMDFFISTSTTDFDKMDSSSLYYRIYIDGDVWEFEPEGDEFYPGLNGPTTDIPYQFNNDWDIMYDPSYGDSAVFLYFEGMTTVGVQTVYKYNGRTTESDILTYNVETGDESLEESGMVSVISTDVVSSTYYDLNGRKINNPDKGIYLLRQTLSDGTSVTRKLVRK